mmetsp:Transcript_12011/g.30744  ORF Transcript_12011/g.30744 Transcript_12011/m.30744 type:complete len:227 (+) Transcript_12011:621-1301(+)
MIPTGGVGPWCSLCVLPVLCNFTRDIRAVGFACYWYGSGSEWELAGATVVAVWRRVRSHPLRQRGWQRQQWLQLRGLPGQNVAGHWEEALDLAADGEGPGEGHQELPVAIWGFDHNPCVSALAVLPPSSHPVTVAVLQQVHVAHAGVRILRVHQPHGEGVPLLVQRRHLCVSSHQQLHRLWQREVGLQAHVEHRLFLLRHLLDEKAGPGVAGWRCWRRRRRRRRWR